MRKRLLRLFNATDTLKKVNYTKKYYNKLFDLAKKKNFSLIKNLSTEKNRRYTGGEPSFLIILNFRNSENDVVENVIPFSNFALLREEMYKLPDSLD